MWASVETPAKKKKVPPIALIDCYRSLTNSVVKPVGTVKIHVISRQQAADQWGTKRATSLGVHSWSKTGALVIEIDAYC